MTEQYLQSELLADNAFLTLLPGLGLQKGSPSSVIAGSVQQSNETTLNGRLTICGQDSLTLKSSRTLGPGLTSKGKDCKPYWNDFCAETSSKLWLPTVTGLSALDLTQSDFWSKKTVGKSWFSTHIWEAPNPNSLPIFSPYSTIFHAGCTECDHTVAQKIRLYPTAVQKKIFRSWLGASRFVYNKTVEMLNGPKETRATHWMAAAKQILPELPEWAKEIPYQVKKIAVEDAFKAFSNGVKKYKKTGEVFSLGFRSRKDPKQSCFIPSSALRSTGIYPKIAGQLKKSEQWPDGARDSRLVFEHGRWFCLVPKKIAFQPAENQGRVVAIDPGIRTFATLYAVDGAAKVGDGDYYAILRRCFALDDLISRISKATARKKRRLKKAADKLRFTIRNLVDELHFKLIRMLLNSFDTILLPTFETSEMVSRAARKIRAKSVRSMLTWGHFRFKQRLKSAAARIGKTVMDVNEAYTSKTASWTGEMKKIGGAKQITSGGITVDRDVNGARGIFLRVLVDNPGLRNQACSC
jgi:putative transposase